MLLGLNFWLGQVIFQFYINRKVKDKKKVHENEKKIKNLLKYEKTGNIFFLDDLNNII